MKPILLSIGLSALCAALSSYSFADALDCQTSCTARDSFGSGPIFEPPVTGDRFLGNTSPELTNSSSRASGFAEAEFRSGPPVPPGGGTVLDTAKILLSQRSHLVCKHLGYVRAKAVTSSPTGTYSTKLSYIENGAVYTDTYVAGTSGGAYVYPTYMSRLVCSESRCECEAR